MRNNSIVTNLCCIVTSIAQLLLLPLAIMNVGLRHGMAIPSALPLVCIGFTIAAMLGKRRFLYIPFLLGVALAIVAVCLIAPGDKLLRLGIGSHYAASLLLYGITLLSLCYRKTDSSWRKCLQTLFATLAPLLVVAFYLLFISIVLVAQQMHDMRSQEDAELIYNAGASDN